MKTIYFVRHGQSQANVDKVFAGTQLDSPLTQKGLEQADLTALALRGKEFDVIVSSPLARAKTTAERIAEKTGYSGQNIVEPLLAERDFGMASGRLWADIGEEVDSGTVEGMETLEQLAARMRRLLDWFATVPSEQILAVGHGSAEIVLQTIYQGSPVEEFLQTKELGNAEIREYKISV